LRSESPWPEGVQVVEGTQGREILLVGTAHVSRESVALVRLVIERARPDRVCVELDEGRHKALAEERRFEELDLRQVLRERQLATLMMNLTLAAYQRQLGLQLGVAPGTELLEATRVARELGCGVELCDRDVRVTLRRAWRAMSLWQRFMLLSALLGSLFERPQITEDELRALREEDVLSRLLRELGDAFPALKRVLIDERDTYLAERIARAEGRRVVAVVGAGHVAGIRDALERRAGGAVDLTPLEYVPAASRIWRVLGWAIPAVILGSLLWIGLAQGLDAARENLVFWILANGVPCALGAVLALAHPLTWLTGFLAAPVTSLTPVIGAGYVTAFVQTWLRPPKVRELRAAARDAASARGWWRNRLLRIFLVFVFTTLGSLLGTWVGGARIVSNLFRGG
jgi:pheromone shutdown-related protein TraB